MIGLFDSGVGGLSVLRAMIQNGINDDFIYLEIQKMCRMAQKQKSRF